MKLFDIIDIKMCYSFYVSLSLSLSCYDVCISLDASRTSNGLVDLAISKDK